jgi:hypothetical protein
MLSLKVNLTIRLPVRLRRKHCLSSGAAAAGVMNITARRLFFGRTPASSGEEPTAAVPILTVGNVQGDWETLRDMGGSITAKIEKA